MIPVWKNQTTFIIGSFREVELVFSVIGMAVFGNEPIGLIHDRLIRYIYSLAKVSFS